MNARKPLSAVGLVGLVLVLALGTTKPAAAAQTCEAPPSPDIGTTCFATTTETVTIEQPVPGTTTTQETFKTRIIVQGPDGVTFDQTVNAPSDSPAASDATAAATTSATDDGLRVTAVETSNPERTLSSSTQSEVVTPDREEVSVATETTFGPDTAQVGPDRSETLIVPDGATLFNTVTTTTRYVDVTTNTTNTYLTTATITIVAVAPTTTTASTTSTAPAAVSPGSTDTPTGELARTGSSNGPWTAAGITLVLAGAACLHLSRRTARRQAA